MGEVRTRQSNARMHEQRKSQMSSSTRTPKKSHPHSLRPRLLSTPPNLNTKTPTSTSRPTTRPIPRLSRPQKPHNKKPSSPHDNKTIQNVHNCQRFSEHKSTLSADPHKTTQKKRLIALKRITASASIHEQFSDFHGVHGIGGRGKPDGVLLVFRSLLCFSSFSPSFLPFSFPSCGKAAQFSSRLEYCITRRALL